ncbi:phosphotransferase family protein [Dictyobacter kobayashii]|uniref:Putative aminoglycoside phosphotransferase n=1 Tax=Dictyobacter kobayashii TaxID=2014872 RepID=A0A402AW67_9CHLR|nr:aminoglycoside phosphotransferase family protein [Dictyobacter kobayashii]GCE23329.1 putative aminoglycoside phosphotransferase [Dictyobacter kobayashii]
MQEDTNVALDIEQPAMLKNYLQQHNRIGPDEDPIIQVLAGGISNRTVLVQRSAGESWVVKQALSKLRVATDWFSSPERIHREALGIRWLSRLAPAGTITPFIFEDHTQHLLAMQAVPQPHINWKTLLLAGQVQDRHVAQFGHLLGSIHRNAYEQREEVARVFADTSFFESLRIEPYYLYTASQVPEAATFIDTLVQATRANQLTLVHGDYSPKNVLIYADQLILLDHEVIHYGDPAFDIGFSLTHLLSKAHHLTEQRQEFAQAASIYWQNYKNSLGDVPWFARMEERAVRHTLACMLARVAGRSLLEYFSSAERQHQCQVILSFIDTYPATIPELISQFIERINHNDDN